MRRGVRPRVRYTLLLTRTGGGSRVLSFPAWALLLLLGLLLAWTGLNLYLWHRTKALRDLQAGLRVQGETVRRLSLALEAERAQNRALQEEARKALEELENLKKALDELRRRAGLSPINATPVRYETPGPGGQGGGALALWEAVGVEVLDLRNQLREVTPALERTLELEAGLPQGLPLRTGGGITSYFGMRKNPFGPGYEFHDGVDFSAPYGAPVYATAYGTVAQVGWMGPYGLAVLLDHPGGYRTLYGHLSRILAQPGARVERGEVVGYVGSTGRSTGPHLHYSVYRYGTPLDPLAYLSR